MRSTKTIAIALIAVALIATSALAVIDGTDHDLRSRLQIDQICQPCHAPHNAIHGYDGPIWNHQIVTRTFTRTDWETGVTENITLSGSSKLCMSCHDGLTAVGNFGGISDATDPITGDAALDLDFTDDHPIGVEYPSDSHILRDPAEVANYLEDGKIECGSCHYAHGGQDDKFLRVTIVNSELCGVCHTFTYSPAERAEL